MPSTQPPLLKGRQEVGFDTSNDIEPQAWKEALRLMNEATVEGISSAGTTGSRLSLAHDRRFLNNLRHSNEVFTAFKVHSMGVKMAERLYDSKGNLRSFAEFQKAVAPIASHQVGSWLRTEYNTAVRRAHLASDWQEFEANKDIFPNLRWMPTTSPNAEGSHRIYWERKLTLPINDPFWAKHHPGDRWNCKCSLEATDAPTTAPPDEREAPKPQQGLDRNPKDGQLFSDKHPYFPKDCASCPFNKGVKNKLISWFSNRKKDCYNCEWAQGCIDRAKGATTKYDYLEDKKYGERLLVSKTADPTDFVDNRRVARALLSSFPNMRIKIRPHSSILNVKNPELEIDGVIADNKKIEGEQGVTAGFKKALNKQGCKAVVIDLDAHVKRLRINDLSKYISNRKADFDGGRLEACYVVYKNKAVKITTSDKETIKQILHELNKKASE